MLNRIPAASGTVIPRNNFLDFSDLIRHPETDHPEPRIIGAVY
jgi:hypothetical protein